MNAPAEVPVRRDSVLRQIGRWARDHPAMVAVVAPGRVLTYEALWASASGWATAVRGRFSEPEEVVGVFRTRETDLPVCQLAAWLAGSAYIPLDPSLPDQRVAQILPRGTMSGRHDYASPLWPVTRRRYPYRQATLERWLRAVRRC